MPVCGGWVLVLLPFSSPPSRPASLIRITVRDRQWVLSFEREGHIESTSATCGLHRGHTCAKHFTGFYLQIYRIPTGHLKQSLPLHQATEKELRGLVHNQQRECGVSALQCRTIRAQCPTAGIIPCHSGWVPDAATGVSQSMPLLHIHGHASQTGLATTQALHCVSVTRSVDHRDP